MKIRLITTISLVLTLLSGGAAHADVAVLLHGLLKSSSSWERSGAVDALQELGWERAGRAQVGGPTGVMISRPQQKNRGNRILYLADIPTLIPLEQQADLLEKMLVALSDNHPGEPIYLIGHSAGGVVTRMVVVRNSVPNIKALITVAAPHLGSPYANLAYDLATLPYPFRLVPKMMAHKKYKVLRKSRPMIKGLMLAHPGTMLHWLNRQPHPDIAYFSIIRRQPPSKVREALVPFWSQDMNNIVALREGVDGQYGRAVTIPTLALHRITMQDGYLLGTLLGDIAAGQ